MTKWKGEAASYASNAAQLVSSTARAWAASFLPAALLIGLAASPAFAADRYWDPNRNDSGWGGSGIWNTSNLFWSPNSDGTSGPYNASWNNVALDDAIFGSTAGTITLGSPITVHTMTFQTSGWTLNDNTLTLAGTTPTIRIVGNDHWVRINSAVAGTAGLRLAGAGDLYLNNINNSFSGGIVLDGSGTLVVEGGNGSLGAASNTITMNGGTLSSGAVLSSRTVILAGNVTLGGLAGSARITGTGNVAVAPGGSMSNDASTYVGDTTFGAYNLWGGRTFTSVRNTGEASSLGSSGDIYMASIQQGAEIVTYQGNGDTSNRTFRLDAINHTMSFVNGGTGTLALTGSIILEGTSAHLFNASTADFALTGTISALSTGSLDLNGGAGRTITLGGANTYSGATSITTITAVASTLADIGGNSSFGTGSADSQIHINNGALQYTGDGDGSNRTWMFSNNATLRNNGSGGLTLTGAAEFNPGLGLDVLHLAGTYAGVNTISGNLTGSGSVSMNGAGTWVLSGANSYTGTTTVTTGTLAAGSATAFNPLSGATVNGGELDLGGFDTGFTRLDGTGGTVDLGAGDLTLNVATGVTANYAGTITGSGGLTKTGGGTQTLAGTNTYSGATNLGGGTLALNFAAATAPTNDIISSASTLNMGGGTVQMTGAATEANSQTFNGLNITAGSNRIAATAGASGGTMTVNFGDVERTGGQIDFGIATGVTMNVAPGTTLGGWATVNGADYADVNASNQIVAFTAYDLKDNAATWLDGDIVTDTQGVANSPFTGTASDAAGDNIVQLGGLRYTVAAASTVTVGTGQTLGVDGTIIIASTASTTQTISGGSVRGAAGGALGIQQNSAGTFTINSTIVDNGGATGLTVGGTGTGSVVLGNTANTYTGPTWVTRARLSVGTLANGGVASSIGDSSADSANLVLEGGTLAYTGGNVTTDRGFTLMRSGAVTGGTIEVTQGASNLTFGGEIVSPDGAGLTKTGPGTLTLTNANSSYTGVTAVSAGTLAVTTLTNGGANSSIGAATAGSANIVLTGGGTLEFLGTAATSSNRGFTVGAGGGRIGVSDAATTLTISGVATGTGGFTKTGDGTLILSGANTYTGGTRVSEGTLQAGSATAFGGSTNYMDVVAGATLALGGYNISVGALTGSGQVNLGANTLTSDTTGSSIFSGTISGTGGLTRTGGGTGVLAIAGCGNDYTGATTITGSTLSVACLADGLLDSAIGASSSASANLVIANSGALQYTGGDVAIDRGFTLQSNAGYITVTQATTELEFEGTVAGAGALYTRGPGTLILSGTNTYTGGTVVESGTLIAGSSSAFGTGSLYISAGGTVDATGFDTTVAALSDSNTTGGEIRIADKTLTLTSGGATFAGRITGTTGRLVKNGGSTQTLSGCNNSYGGSTTINAGWIGASCLANGGLNSSIGSSSADASNLIIGGTSSAGLVYNGSGASTDRRFTMGNTAYIRNDGSGALNFTSTAAITQSGTGGRSLILGGSNNTNVNILAAQITNNGTSAVSFLKESGGSTWRLSNATSNYTGSTIVESGVLEVTKLANGGTASSIGASTAAANNLHLRDEGHLRYIGTGDSTDRLFRLAVGTTYIESSGTGAINFTGTGGTMAFETPGARTLALGGTYTGDNIMGVVIADQNATTGKTTLAKNDAGTWILTGNNTYTGNTVINDGKLIIGNGGTTGNVGTGPVILAFDTGTLGFNRSDTVNFAGQISGPGIIEQMGEGTTNLTAVNSAGTTRITEGTLQVNGILTTGTITFEDDEATTLVVNGTVQGAGVPTTITGDASANIINVNSGGMLIATGDLGGGSDTVTLAGTLNTGAGTLSLGGGNDTLTLNDGGVITGGVMGGAGTDTLLVNNTANRTLTATSVPGFEVLDKQGTGILRLTGAHGYEAGVTVRGGTLALGDGTTAGSLAGDILIQAGADVSFNSPGVQTYAGTISGAGWVNKNGSGTQILTGNNTYTGSTTVNAGTLLIDGDQSGATGPTVALNGTTLGGSGTIGGDVTMVLTSRLSPGGGGNAPGTLTINGDLTLGGVSNLDFNFGQAGVAGGAYNDLVEVGGDLTLDGTLNITETPGGDFGPGVYRIFNYDGTLINNGLNVASPDYFVQTSVADQVNLVNSAGLTLSYWDGDAGPHSNGAVNGGAGTWRAAGDQNWTDSTGVFAAPFANASFAIFQTAPGAVTVDDTNGPVQALGMQFATHGYVVQGDGIELVDDSTQAGLQSVIRVGDGTAAGASYVATVASALSGSTQLVKTDLGTLVLMGTNTYTAGTAINGGTLEVSADANLGAAGGALSLNGGTLRNSAAIASGRAVTLNAGGGTFETVDTLTLSGVAGGAGVLTKTGAGTLVLNGANSYQGGTIIHAGTVEVSADANLGNAGGGLTFNGGRLHSTANFTAARNVTLNAGGGTFDTDNGTALTLANAVVGAGALTKAGGGALTLTNTNSYAGGTTISAGTLQLGNGGALGSITGNVLNDGTLAFNRNNGHTFAGLISGSGSVEQIGSGTTILTGNNSYDGETWVREGTLLVNGNQSAATGTTTVEDGGTLGGIGTLGGDVDVLDGGVLNPGNVGAAPGTLTVGGNLTFAENAALNYNFGQAGVVGGAYNDLTVVQGDLALDGTINVTETPGGSFGPGIYRIISYDGSFTNLGLSENSTNHVVQTSIEGQVNLVEISAMTLNFWDGDAGPKADDFVDGGNGIWRAAGDDNWTDESGDINAAFSNGSFPIFAGAAGTVEVDNSNGQVQASGMQFATGGYLIEGDNITLVGPQSTIRVGDGTLPGAAYVATIGSVLEGSAQLVKSDLGTLVLTGANTFTGGTRVNGGTLQVASEANLGNANGGLSFDGGTLHTTAAFASARGVMLEAGGGTFETDADLMLSGLVGGTGGFTKTGSAALILTGNNTHTGATTVSAGGLYVDGDQSAASGPVSVQTGAALGGNGVIGGDVAVADGATLSPGSADGTPGTLAIAGNLALSSGSILNYSFGEANVAGGTLNDLTTVGGNLVLDGTLNVSVSSGGTFGPGVYRVFSYNGALTNNDLSVGSIPSTNYFIQTAIANQVNLVNAQGLTMNYWDGAAGPKFDGVVNGGDGVWQNATGNDNWADATGIINAPFSDGSFAIFAGTAGTVTVDNAPGQVTASGLQFMTDGYLIQGGSIALDGGATSTIRVGDGTAAGAGITATIAAQLSGNTQLVKTDLGTLVLSGANSYSGGTAINGGMLQVSADANLGDAAGALSFNGGTLQTTASFTSSRNIDLLGQGTFLTDDATTLTLDGRLSGSGSFVKSGAGKLVLASDGSGFAGVTSIDDGTLAVNGSLCGDVNVRSGGRLQGTGTVCDTNNFAGGTVAPGNSIGTLTVAGDYAGSGGTLEIETALGGDASPTDRLIVTGNTAGTTRVRVINLDGGGAQTQNGIEIVDVGGASNGSFSLAGDYVFDGEQAVVGGAYAYRLYKNGISTPNDGDWYLRSTYLSPDNPAPQPLYAPGVPLYEAYAGVLQSFNELGTLQQRVGNRTWGEGATAQGADVPGQGPVDGKAIWARIQAAHSQLDPDVSTTAAAYDVSIWKLQAGLDGMLHEGGAGMLIGGLTAHYGTVSSDVSSLFGNGSIDATGYGFGGTLTWYGNNGFYIDAQAEATWYDSDIRSSTLGNTLAKGNDGFGYALSMEGGQKIALDGNWSLTPQAQLAYSAVDFDDFTDPYGAVVALGNSDSLIGRLGMSLDYENQWADAAGQVSRSHVYGIANLYYDFLDGSDVDVSGVSLVSQNQALWGGLGLGGSLNWADGRYSVYGEAIARGSFEDMADNNSIRAKLGFSVKW
jgi:fibronectin-binding autotransporter adhesin